MATNWIKMRTDLFDDPKVRWIAKEMKCHVVSAIGCLYVLWSMADQHTTNGILWTYTAAEIDKRVGREGFAKACASKEIDWLDVQKDRITIKRFDEHNGESAKARAQVAKRVRKLRRHDEDSPPTTQPDVTLRPLPDKRRLEKNHTPPSADSGDGGGGDQPQPKPKRVSRTGPHAGLIDRYLAGWETRYGSPRVIRKEEWPKVGAAFSKLLEDCGGDFDRAAKVIEGYLADEDEYVVKARHAPMLMQSRINNYIPTPGASRSKLLSRAVIIDEKD